MRKRLLATLAATLLLTSAVAAPPKREFRSSWVAGMNIDWPYNSSSKGTSAKAISNAKKELTDYLDNFKNQNFTGICFHVRPRADAYYKSSYEPWSGDISGTRGLDPGWDPLAFAVEECHKRGLECYAWINPFRVNANNVTYTTDFDKQWAEDGWLIYSGKWTIFNLAVPGARKHCMDVIKEIYTNYNIDGMLFDDYFYPGDGMVDTSEADDYEQWKSSGTTMTIGDWRRDNVNRFVKDLYNEIQQTRPDLRFGIGPAGVAGASASKYGLSKPNISSTDWMYAKIYCDPLAWLNDGTIDFISPQVYWGTTNTVAPFEPLCEWWSDVAKHFGRHMYISAATYKMADNASDYGGGNNIDGWNEIATEINLTRDYTANNAPGMIYYNTRCINGPQISGLGDHIAKTSYTAPSLVPVVDWKDHTTYAAPSGLTKSGTSLSWTATTGATDKSIIRYTVYAIPQEVSLEGAQSTDGDGLKGEYLLGVSYNTTYTIPTAKASSYWYAVCVYDGFGYESSPATIGYATEPSEASALVSPANGARADWDTQFSWTAVSDATYRLQLSTNANFNTLAVDKANLTSTSQSVDFGNLTASQYYWRVITTQSGKLPANSNVYTVLPPVKSAAPKATLVLPANGAKIEDAEMSFSWTCQNDANVDGFRLEVIKEGGNFSNPLYTTNVTGKQQTVATSNFGQGSFVWRVVAYGSRYTETASETAQFVIEELPITEVGYSVKTDGTTYNTKSALSLKSNWMRSTKSGWENIEFVIDDYDNVGAFNRGMVATKNAVYISGRSDNSTSADLYLNVYSAANGQFLQQLTLWGYEPLVYGCNDLIKDSKGNICTYNLTLSSTSGRSLYVYNINTETGQMIEVAHINTGTLGRIDHLAVYGDVTSGNFTIMSAISSSNKIAVWKVTNGTVGTVTTKTVSNFYPSGVSTFGIAPRVIPVSETQAYVDGGNTMWTLYDLSSTRPTILGSFADNSAIKPVNAVDNGGAVFSLKNHTFMVYNRTSSGYGTTFHIVRKAAGNTDTDFKAYESMWIVPEKGLGDYETSTTSAPVDVVVISDSEARIYVYSVGNGLAAYTISDTTASVVDGIASDNDSQISIDGLTVHTGTTASVISACTLTGAVAATAYDANSITLPAPGIYLINVDGVAHKVTLH